jgi:hypothetical protein
MSGIAICFPMSDLLVGSVGNMKSIAKYMGRIKFSMKMSGRKAEDYEGMARRANMRRGIPRSEETKRLIALNNKGRTKDVYMPRAHVAEKLRLMEKTEAQRLGDIEKGLKKRGRTKDNDPSVERGASKKRGRTKETHEGLMRLSEKHKGRFLGEKSGMWIDGRSYLPYSKEFNKHKREYIKERDGHTCQYCGMSEAQQKLKDKIGRGLTIHHINYDKQYNDDINLITTCRSCNCNANLNREYWQRFYTDKLLIKTNGILVYG